jgi:hypothetical protein
LIRSSAGKVRKGLVGAITLGYGCKAQLAILE